MLGHELTHIRNGDVQMMVIAVIIAGVVGFFAELFFRSFTNFGYYGGGWSVVVVIVVLVVVFRQRPQELAAAARSSSSSSRSR